MAAALRPLAAIGALCILLGAACSHAVSDESTLWERWADRQGLDGQATRGARIFVQAGCTTCHVYLGEGKSRLGGADLSEEGERGRGEEWQIAHLKCPSCLQPGSVMPPFADFTEPQYRELAAFLEQSRGSET
jgi:cbb3-type cytochrome oxidase cytochrome c subunit